MSFDDSWNVWGLGRDHGHGHGWGDHGHTMTIGVAGPLVGEQRWPVRCGVDGPPFSSEIGQTNGDGKRCGR